jgi:quercetin dioxygenase-like cupin family protein
MNQHLQLAASLFVLMSCGAAFAQDNAGNSPMTRDISNPDQFSVVHGDLKNGNADVVAKFPANSITPHHWHTTAERMVLLSGELHLTYDGHETLILKPGSYAYGPAKLAHTAACTKDAPCVLFIATELPFDEVPDLAHMDADRDARVSLAEFQDGLFGWDAMDLDHDQVVSRDEPRPGGGAKSFTRAEDRARMATPLAQMFGAQDSDGDGYLDAKELAAPPSPEPASASKDG